MSIKFMLLLLVTGFCDAQTDSSYVAIDSATLPEVPYLGNSVTNPDAIRSFYSKLAALGSNASKVNIVHIGDSHIQADMMTGAARQQLQKTYGNAGRGFVFPHNLAKTNGSHDIRFTSTDNFASRRNIYEPDGSPVGLSGIALESKKTDFAITLKVKDEANFFSTLKVVTPDNANAFSVALTKGSVTVEVQEPKNIMHKIRKGETLSAIAAKYDVGVTQIKNANGLRSNTINAGKTLSIPAQGMQNRQTERAHFDKIGLTRDSLYHFYKSENQLEQIYLVSNDQHQQGFALNGIVLENDSHGILYHNIGVNGAKYSDYNKYPLFFDQLRVLQPDLIIVSLGTNESFDKMAADAYLLQMELFIANVRKINPDAAILIATAPPSMFQRKYPNTFVADYARLILENAEPNRYSVWDLYGLFGGLYGIDENVKQGLIGGDRVHYTRAGYEKQGRLLAEAIINGMQQFRN